jgi:ribonuclease HI
MSACIVICRPNQKPQALSIDNLGHGTNNVAEWSALLWATQWLRDNGITKCHILGDSNLAIQQARGAWKIKNQLLAEIAQEYQEVAQGLDLQLDHVGRDLNLAGRYLEFGTV